MIENIGPKEVFLERNTSISKYDITIIPNIQNHMFKGNITIYFSEKTQKDSFLILDASKTLHFHQINDLKIKHDNKKEKIIIETPKNIDKINLLYDGKIFIDDLYGLYQTKDVITGTIGLATQFEPDFAKRVFPCIDSPHSRSVYKLSLSAEKNLTVLANTKLESREVYKDGYINHFKETPKMPAYLVAFCVGVWDKTSTKTKRGVEIDVYTLKGRGERGEFSKNIAAKSIDFFENYTGVDYVMDCLQIVAIPDFAAGAMENYGLVTCRDFFVDSDNNTSLISLSRIAEVIVHENAHMWFGNLVSPSSWSYTWLNEAFATILPHIALEDTEYFPWSELYCDVMQSAINFDISSYTHPIMFHNFTDPNLMFDDITYRKGATVLNMLRLYLSENVFQKCIKDYLNTYKFTATTTKELVSSFEKSSNKDIGKFIHVWTEESGFPTLYVSKENKGMKIEQKRVTPSGVFDSDFAWSLQLCFSNGKSVLMNEKVITLDYFSYVNFGRKAMTIINYSDEIIKEMIENWKNIPNDIKWCFLEDLQKLVLCGVKKPSLLITFIKLCTEETDIRVISSLCDVSAFIVSSVITSDTENSKSTIECIVNILKKYIQYNKNNSMSLVDVKTRNALITIVGHMCGDKSFTDEFSKGKTISEDDEFEDLFFYSWTENGFNKLESCAKNSKNTRFIQNAYAALASSRDVKSVNRLTDMFGKDIKWQNAIMVINKLSTNKATRKATYYYMCNNIELFHKMYGNGFRMESVINIAYSLASSSDELSKIDAIIKKSTIYSEMKSVCDRFCEIFTQKNKIRELIN